MKKLLIIIGISVFFLMIAAGAAYNSQIIHVDQLYRNMPSSTCYQPTTDKPHEDAVWNLDECYWFVDDPNIPYELQKVLDNCDCQESGQAPCPFPRLGYSNDTHSIDNIDCKWEEIGILIEWEKYVRDGPEPIRETRELEDDDLNTKGCPQFCPKDEEDPDLKIYPRPANLTEDKALRDKYKDLPEVVAFYAKYDDAQVSVREDNISYFAGSSDAAFIRMNVFYDDDKTLDHIETKCYFQKVLQFEIAQEDIVNSLEKYDCKK